MMSNTRKAAINDLLPLRPKAARHNAIAELKASGHHQLNFDGFVYIR